MTVDLMLYRALLGVHLVAGIGALAVFWIPAALRKGSLWHRRFGRLFTVLMTSVIATGVPLALRMFAEGHWVGGTFILYLGVITATAVGTAWYALKLKREADRYFGRTYRAVAVLNIASGSVVIVLGYVNAVWLLFGFGFVGVLAGLDMRKKARAFERPANWWLLEHLGGMIGAGMAAHIAFGAFGLRRLWPAYASFDGWIGMLPWFLPVVVGVAATMWLDRKYANGLPRPSMAR